MAAPAVSVSNLGKRFRIATEHDKSIKAAALRGRRAKHEDLWALRNISFDVLPGTTFGIIGSNGSGKSTLLKCLARILRPDEGEIHYAGSMSALLELGAGFHPELSGRENVFLNGAILGLPAARLEERFDDIVKFAGLERFIDEPVKNYSSGMYVRLGFSVAINVDPDVLVVDEVLAVGDINFQQRCNDKFDEFAAAGKTVIVVSHALDRMKSMCDDIVWIEQGELQMIGPADEVCDAYAIEMQRIAQAEGRAAQQVAQAASDDQLLRSVELLDAEGQQTDTIFVGAALRIRVTYDASRFDDQVVVGLGFHRDDGFHAADVNAGWQFEHLAGHDGLVTVDYAIDSVPLLKGHYNVSVTLHDKTVLTVLARDDRAADFHVVPRGPVPESGMVAFEGEWSATSDAPTR